MRTAVLILSGLAVIVFAALFVATFVGRDYFARQAQGYVIDKTQRYADPLVEVADQAAKAPGVKLLLNEEQLLAARREIAKYRDGPRAYVADLVGGRGKQAEAVAPGPNAALKEKVLLWKQKIREYFDDTLDRLLRDLRIFFGSNLAAALLAMILAWRARPERLRGLSVISAFILASVAFQVYMYIDSMTYFRILIGAYIGWWYPVILAMCFLGMLIDYEKASPPRASTT